MKLPKKGGLGSCQNWRGIQLLSLASKVLTRILLEQIKRAVDECIRDEQAGFRSWRSCTDLNATLRIIIEQSLEWRLPLYITFVDFRKAFGMVDRCTLWRVLRHYEYQAKLLTSYRYSTITPDARPYTTYPCHINLTCNTYLGSVVNKQGGAHRDISVRIGKARQAFVMLRNIWKNNNTGLKTKLRIFETNVKSVLLYGSETWKQTKKTEQDLQVFVNKCLH